MGSNLNNPKATTIPPTKGEESAILLGAQALSSLASLINWKNSTTFDHPNLTPWANLTDSSSPPSIVQDNPSEPATTEPIAVKPVPIEPAAREPAIIEPAVIEPAATEPAAIEKTASELKHEPIASVNVQQPLSSSIDAPPIKALGKADSAIAPAIPIEESVDDRVISNDSLSLPASDTPVATEPISIQKEKRSAEDDPKPIGKVKAVSDSNLAKVAVESKSPKLVEKEELPSVAAPVVSSATGATVVPRSKEQSSSVADARSQAIVDDTLQRQSPIIAPVLKESSSKESIQRDQVPIQAMPPKRPSPPIVKPTGDREWEASFRTVRPSDASVSTDEYLRQLERLVIELNIELGMRESDSSSRDGDNRSHLVSRMIDLNLQNLALKEQLRAANGHH